MGRVLKAHNPDGTVTQWVFNNLDNTVEVFDENLNKTGDAKGNTTSYKYGIFGIERISYSNNIEEIFTYDCIGNVIEKTSGDRVPDKCRQK